MVSRATLKALPRATQPHPSGLREALEKSWVGWREVPWRQDPHNETVHESGCSRSDGRVRKSTGSAIPIPVLS